MVGRGRGRGVVRPSVVESPVSSTDTEPLSPQPAFEPPPNRSPAPQIHPQADFTASPPPLQQQHDAQQMPRQIPIHPPTAFQPIDAEDACLIYINNLQQLRAEYQQAKERIQTRFFDDIYHLEHRRRHQ